MKEIEKMFGNDDDYQDSAYLFDPTGKLLTDEEENNIRYY